MDLAAAARARVTRMSRPRAGDAAGGGGPERRRATGPTTTRPQERADASAHCAGPDFRAGNWRGLRLHRVRASALLGRSDSITAVRTISKFYFGLAGRRAAGQARQSTGSRRHGPAPDGAQASSWPAPGVTVPAAPVTGRCRATALPPPLSPPRPPYNAPPRLRLRRPSPVSVSAGLPPAPPPPVPPTNGLSRLQPRRDQ